MDKFIWRFLYWAGPYLIACLILQPLWLLAVWQDWEWFFAVVVDKHFNPLRNWWEDRILVF